MLRDLIEAVDSVAHLYGYLLNVLGEKLLEKRPLEVLKEDCSEGIGQFRKLAEPTGCSRWKAKMHTDEGMTMSLLIA